MLINILIFAAIALGITVAALITLFCVAAAVRSSQLSAQERMDQDEIDFGRDDIWWLNQQADQDRAIDWLTHEPELEQAIQRNLYRTLSH